MIIVSTEVRFQPANGEREEIVVRVVEGAAVIVISGLLRVKVVDPKIAYNLAVGISASTLMASQGYMHEIFHLE